MRNYPGLARFIFAIFILITILQTSISAQKQSPTRIRFKPGSSSATINGKLTSKKLKHSFLVGATSGQDLIVEVKANSSNGLDFANFLIYSPSGKPIGGDDKGMTKIKLRETGDYRIDLSPPGAFYRNNGEELTFKLSITIR